MSDAEGKRPARETSGGGPVRDLLADLSTGLAWLREATKGEEPEAVLERARLMGIG